VSWEARFFAAASPTDCLVGDLESAMTRTRGAGGTKRGRLVEATLQLMLRRGYWGTTVDDICACANASKGSAFHHFANKEQLALEALDSFVTSIMEHFQRFAATSDAHGIDRVIVLCDEMIQLARVQSAANGCLLATLSMETSIKESALAARCAQYFTLWCAMLEEQFQRALAEHPVSMPMSAEELAQFCISIFEGSLILARACQDVTVVERGLEQFKCYVVNLMRNGSTAA
jgi:TetR/AcrR family transcriptional regulator, transcriptional repressor for nem operon